jgi:hypothetical protein
MNNQNNQIDEIVAEALKRSDEGQSLTAYLRAHSLERDDVDAILSARVRIERVGARLAPSADGLRTALGLVQPEPVLSPLFISSFFMNSTSKMLAGALALVLVIGGGYLVTMPGEQLVMESDSTQVATEDASANSARMMMATETTAAPAATADIQDISAAMTAELAAENAGLAAFDQEVNADVAATNALTNTNDMNYDAGI